MNIETKQPGVGTLYFLSGRAGSGKSTFARQLSLERQAILICEDQWLARLFGGATTLQEYLEQRGRIRQLLTEWAPQTLRGGHSLVFDFAGNTVADRAWVRSLLVQAGAAHELHYMVADESLCRRRIYERNHTRPEGIYWGDVSDALFDQVNRYFQPPTPAEGFEIIEHVVPE